MPDSSTPNNHQEIIRRLDRLHSDLERALARVEHHDRILTGNGEPHQGHVVRVDRIEQELLQLRKLQRRANTWALTLVSAAAIGFSSLVSFLAQFILS